MPTSSFMNRRVWRTRRGRQAEQERVMARQKENVPVGPFMELLNEWVEHYRAIFPGSSAEKTSAAIRKVAEDLGWEGEPGMRKLYRYRRGLKSTRNRRTAPNREIPTGTFPRATVEDALHRAGVDFYSIYPEFSHERDIELEPAAWCPACREHCHPIGGCCPWCDWRISDGHMNMGMAA